MDRIKGNILISEFEGYKITFGMCCNYDKDWNILIPVIKKIQDIGIKNEPLFQEGNDIYDALLTLDIIKTWNAVTEFIEKYNKITK